MIRRRYPTPREIRRAQWAWIPLLLPLFTLAWFIRLDIALNIQKRRLDYEFNHLTEQNRDATRRLETATADLARRRGQWTSTDFAQALGLRPPQPGQVITVPPIPLDQRVWELPLEPVQGLQARFATASAAPSPADPGMSTQAPLVTAPVVPARNMPVSAGTNDPKQRREKSRADSKKSAPGKRVTHEKKTVSTPSRPVPVPGRRNAASPVPDENPAAWITPL